MSESGSTTAAYRWDELGRLLDDTRGSNVLWYGYDRRDQTTVIYPNGKKLTSTLDAAGRLQSLDDWRGSGSGRTSFTYGRRRSQGRADAAAS